MGKEALVIRREILFKDGEFEGFMPTKERDFISIILNKENHFYHLRGNELENNSALKQIIPYVWIVAPERKEIFLYKRILTNKPAKEYKEVRYLNSYSGGVGGHIDKETEEGVDNPIMKAMMRELMEEVYMNNYSEPKLIGFINDDSNSLGSVHFGIAAIAEINGEVKAKKSEGLSGGRFYSIKEVDKIFNDSNNEIETWTRISWPFIKDYLQKI